MDDIPFNCGRELVFLVGSVACPIRVESEGASSDPQDKILEPSTELYGVFEPCSFGLFPEPAPETRDESLDAVWVEDLHLDETSEESQEKDSLPEAELSTPVAQTKVSAHSNSLFSKIFQAFSQICENCFLVNPQNLKTICSSY